LVGISGSDFFDGVSGDSIAISFLTFFIKISG